MKQPNPDIFTTYVKKYLSNAMEWTKNNSPNAWNNGCIQNILRYIDGIRTKNELCVRLIYSFGFALKPEYQSDFASNVSICEVICLGYGRCVLMTMLECANIQRAYRKYGYIQKSIDSPKIIPGNMRK